MDIQQPYYAACPVCDFPEPIGDHDICPSCGVHFSYMDSGPEPPSFYHKQLREDWIERGKLWWSPARSKPETWNPL